MVAPDNLPISPMPCFHLFFFSCLLSSKKYAKFSRDFSYIYYLFIQEFSVYYFNTLYLIFYHFCTSQLTISVNYCPPATIKKHTPLNIGWPQYQQSPCTPLHSGSSACQGHFAALLGNSWLKPGSGFWACRDWGRLSQASEPGKYVGFGRKNF